MKGQHHQTCYMRESWGCNCPSKGGGSWVFWVLVIAAVLILSGCKVSDGPECVKYETRMSLVPVFTGKTTTMHPVTTTVCVKYADK
ncbi:hypothetical protein [Streptomyces sp. NPDC058872]|uniref:hypothetical protein n=1 Tax=Streptomyces sp. NPDC058872 TaxID=3346661 RepID=UPI00367B82A0